MTPHELAAQAWTTYLKDTYVNNKGEIKETFAHDWRASNPNNHARIVAYKEGRGSRPVINDGYGPIIVSIVDIFLATAPPPPATFKKVAPRVAYADGGSDARYCLKDFPDNRDDVAQYSPDGLCLGSERSGGSKENCPTSAKEINGREYCSLPLIGDPTKNTGSWTI